MDELTPQELRIARMAGSHLYHIFPKLGVTSRGQLRDALDHALP